MSQLTNEKYDPYAVLRVRDFRFFLLTRFLLTLGFQMQTVIVGWQVYQITKNPLSLGLIGLAEALPFITSALFAGHVADIVRRKLIIQLGILVLFSCGLFLLFYSSSTDTVKLYGVLPIYIAIGFIGIARAFIHPSITAFISQLVERNLYANASTWNSTVWQIAAVSGPALGGIIYGFFNAQVAFITSASLLFCSMILFSLIHNKGIPTAKKQKESLAKSLSTGIKFVFGNKVILGALSLDLFAVLFGGAVALLPVFASEILMAGPEALGIMRAAPAFGAVLMAIIMAYFPPFKNAGRNMLICVASFGLCMILFALSKNIYLSIFILALSGAVDNVSVVIRSTIIQLLTPDEMRGRVSSVNSIFIGSSNELGAFESGFAAKVLGLIPSVIIGGSITIGVVGVTTKVAPTLAKLNIDELQKNS